jgi:hypothetical protein
MNMYTINCILRPLRDLVGELEKVRLLVRLHQMHAEYKVRAMNRSFLLECTISMT